jgi:hypothetical protein
MAGRRNNIISMDRSGLTNGQAKSVEQNRAIIDSCRQAMSRGMGLLGETLFEKLDDTLYKLADKAESNDLQTRYFDAMRDVRKEREGIEESFQAVIFSGYDNFWRSWSSSSVSNEHDEVDFDSLALIESDTLEEELAISSMVARGENICLRELYALEQRFSKLLNGMPVESRNNPLAPDKICNAFRSSIQVLDIDIPTKLVIYKVFEQEVVSHLDEVYAGINELLRDAGVIPKLRPMIRRTKVAATTSGRLGAGDAASGEYRSSGALSHEDEEASAELFDTLRQLLAGIQSSSPTAGVFNPSMPRADTTQVINALSALQHSDAIAKSYDADSGNIGYVNLKSNLLQELRTVAGNPEIGSVKQVDSDTIDMVSMLFDFILGDKNIPDVMKLLLAQLQIPIIKAAILDKGFFAKSSHPARRLLNDMARAVVGWSGEKDKSKNSLYGKIESIVKRILSDFNEDISLYEELGEELSRFLESEQRGSEAAERRTTQIARGKEQLGVAKRRVKAEIDRRIKGQSDMPLAVVNLLNEGWKDVLMLHFLRRGAKSKEWLDALDVMDRLIWTVEPKGASDEREKLLREIPEVISKMRSEMSDILCDQHMLSRLFKDLERVHLNCLQGRKIPAELIAEDVMLKESVEDSSDDSAAIVDSTPLPPREAEKYKQLAESIPLGSWLEIKEKDGAKSRIKLSWRSSVSDNYLFVNRKGIKAKEMDVSELALALRVGSAFVIAGAEDPLMDRAFAAMIASLKGSGHTAPEPA